MRAPAACLLVLSACGDSGLVSSSTIELYHPAKATIAYPPAGFVAELGKPCQWFEPSVCDAPESACGYGVTECLAGDYDAHIWCRPLPPEFCGACQPGANKDLLDVALIIDRSCSMNNGRAGKPTRTEEAVMAARSLVQTASSGVAWWQVDVPGRKLDATLDPWAPNSVCHPDGTLGQPCANIQAGLTSVLANWWGGQEEYATAIYYAATRIPWRPGSRRVMFVFGDECGDLGISTSSAAHALTDRGIRLVAWELCADQVGAVAAESGGTLYGWGGDVSGEVAAAASPCGG